jgi:hypothetical protein
MKFSAFSRFGHYRFTSKPPRGESIFRAMRESHGGVFGDEAFDGPLAGRWFAIAMAIARARATLERAQNQASPLKVYDILKSQERHHGLAPLSTHTLRQRREAFAARLRVVLGPTRGIVEDSLQTAIGDDFVAWVTRPPSEDDVFPDQPWIYDGIFTEKLAQWTTIRITQSVAHLGVPLTRSYEYVSGDTARLVAGTKVVCAPGLFGQQELITLSAVTASTLTATFTRPHEADTECYLRPWPWWFSNSKHSLVVVKNGRARDRNILRLVNDTLGRILGAASTWDVVEENVAPGTAGPFIANQSEPGITPIELVTL